MTLSARTIAFGFLTGVIAVLLFHQGMVLILHLMKYLPNFPWNFKGSVGPLGVPVLVNQMFWGGLWGIAFALLGHLIPIANTLLRGAIFGLVGPYLLGNGLLVPLFKQSGQFIWTWPSTRLVIGALIGGAFGIGVALVHGALAKR
ncbi:MAG: hypothetical protein ACKVON_15210 [Beijerinckiaceae bacterium]